MAASPGRVSPPGDVFRLAVAAVLRVVLPGVGVLPFVLPGLLPGIFDQDHLRVGERVRIVPPRVDQKILLLKGDPAPGQKMGGDGVREGRRPAGRTRNDRRAEIRGHFPWRPEKGMV